VNSPPQSRPDSRLIGTGFKNCLLISHAANVHRAYDTPARPAAICVASAKKRQGG
jgi:hypothetical protein